jgi:phosphoglycerate kinase
MNLKIIQKAKFDAKEVLLRADLDVPISEGKIAEDSRLQASLETINYLRKAGKIIIIGHLGRPEANLKFNVQNSKFSLEPVAEWYADKFGVEYSKIKVEEFDGWSIGEKIVLLENLRFYPQEEENNSIFAQKLSSLADLYVNDAFASSHRAHASIVGVTKFLPSFAGIRLQKEVEELSKILHNPDRPLTIIIGGAKIETKLPLVEKMHHFADYILIGGEIAENDRELAKVAHEKLQNKKSILLIADLTADTRDITEHSSQNFTQVIKFSKTVVWNGPMGLVEDFFDLGTREIAKAVVSSNAYTIVGGGDTVAFLKKERLLSKFNFVSMGGGAMLEFLAGEKLPGIKVLEK